MKTKSNVGEGTLNSESFMKKFPRMKPTVQEVGSPVPASIKIEQAES